MRRAGSLVVLLLAAGNSAVADDLARMQWQVEGIAREALVYVPVPAKTQPTPVVFAFHGHGGTMRNAANKFACHKHWPQAIAVYMQGLNTPGVLTDTVGAKPGWQKALGDQHDRDLKFFDAVLAKLQADYQVDAKRIYATGYSNGGGFTYLLWGTRNDVLAAVAPCAAAAMMGNVPLPANLPPALARQAEAARESMKNARPKPVFHLAGENDTLVRFDWQKRTIDAVRKLNGCLEGKACGPHCTLYPSRNGTPVLTYIHAGGHGQFPDDAPPLIVQFFREHAQP